jgi:hypothetical protein
MKKPGFLYHRGNNKGLNGKAGVLTPPGKLNGKAGAIKPPGKLIKG